MEHAFILLGLIGFPNFDHIVWKNASLKLNKNYKFSLVILFTFMASFSSARDFGEDALYRFLSIIMEACLNIETCTLYIVHVQVFIHNYGSLSKYRDMYIVHCSCTGVYP